MLVDIALSEYSVLSTHVGLIRLTINNIDIRFQSVDELIMMEM